MIEKQTNNFYRIYPWNLSSWNLSNYIFLERKRLLNKCFRFVFDILGNPPMPIAQQTMALLLQSLWSTFDPALIRLWQFSYVIDSSWLNRVEEIKTNQKSIITFRRKIFEFNYEFWILCRFDQAEIQISRTQRMKDNRPSTWQQISENYSLK